MDRWENTHRDITWVIADKLLVNLEDTTELEVKLSTIDVGYIEIDLILSKDTHALIYTKVEDLAGSDVAWDEVSVFRILFFQEVEALIFRDVLTLALVISLLWNPDATAFTTNRF